MASPAQFIPYVLPYAQGCPDVVAKAEILRAAIRFCEESRVWKEFMPPIDIVTGVSMYAIPVPTDATVVVMEQCWLTGTTDYGEPLVNRELFPLTVDGLKEKYSNWLDAQGTPQWTTQIDPDNIILVPRPASDYPQGLRVRACFKPSRSAATLPDFLYERYAQAIGHSAAAQLLSVPGKAWSDPKAAAIQQTMYEAERDHAIRESGKAFGRARNRVRGHYF